MESRIGRSLKRHRCVVMAILQSRKNLVTSDLKERYGDLWLFGALERKQVRRFCRVAS